VGLGAACVVHRSRNEENQAPTNRRKCLIFNEVGATRFELATSWSRNNPLIQQERPFFPSVSAILPLRTTVARARKRLQFFSGNSGILGRCGAQNGRTSVARLGVFRDNLRLTPGCSQNGTYRFGFPARLPRSTIDRRNCACYNIIRPGRAGPPALKALCAYRPGHFFCLQRPWAAGGPRGSPQGPHDASGCLWRLDGPKDLPPAKGRQRARKDRQEAGADSLPCDDLSRCTAPSLPAPMQARDGWPDLACTTLTPFDREAAPNALSRPRHNHQGIPRSHPRSPAATLRGGSVSGCGRGEPWRQSWWASPISANIPNPEGVEV
jgi:hypothetical protein